MSHAREHCEYNHAGICIFCRKEKPTTTQSEDERKAIIKAAAREATWEQIKIVYEPELQAEISKQREQARQEAERNIILLRSDLAWCLGSLRGLGHPAEHIEKQYGIPEEPKRTEQRKES